MVIPGRQKVLRSDTNDVLQDVLVVAPRRREFTNPQTVMRVLRTHARPP